LISFASRCGDAVIKIADQSNRSATLKKTVALARFPSVF